MKCKGMLFLLVWACNKWRLSCRLSFNFIKSLLHATFVKGALELMGTYASCLLFLSYQKYKKFCFETVKRDFQWFKSKWFILTSNLSKEGCFWNPGCFLKTLIRIFHSVSSKIKKFYIQTNFLISCIIVLSKYCQIYFSFSRNEMFW